MWKPDWVKVLGDNKVNIPCSVEEEKSSETFYVVVMSMGLTRPAPTVETVLRSSWKESMSTSMRPLVANMSQG